MPKRLVLLLVITAMPGFGMGCTIVDQQMGPPLPLDQIDDVPLRSHYSEVLDRFGPPAKISALADGMVFQYEHVDILESQVGLILPGHIGKLIKGVYASADADAETVVFVFDDDGLLVGSDAEAWIGDAGSSQSITLLVSAESVADTERYEAGFDGILLWGAASTRLPLEALNRASDLENGANGVQLTATPPSVGQHTLSLEN